MISNYNKLYLFFQKTYLILILWYLLRFPSDSVKASYVNISWVLKDFYTGYNVPVKSIGHIYLFGNMHSILANIFYQFFSINCWKRGVYYFLLLLLLSGLPTPLLSLSSILPLSLLISLSFWDTVLDSPGWPWTHYITTAGLELLILQLSSAGIWDYRCVLYSLSDRGFSGKTWFIFNNITHNSWIVKRVTWKV